MASYVQLGRGWRPNYAIASLQPHRRRADSRGIAVILVLAAAVFGAGLALGRLDTSAGHASSAAATQPMQLYPR